MNAAANLLAYCAQITLLILLCAGLPRMIRLSSPVVQHAFWRLLLVVCLALPLLQPWRTRRGSSCPFSPRPRSAR